MDETPSAKIPDEEKLFSQQVGAQAARKLKAQRGVKKSVWFGLGMSGLVGWSVTIPALLGAALGIWVDTHYPSRFSWTLMLLLIGLILGCITAWHWVESQYREMNEDSDE